MNPINSHAATDRKESTPIALLDAQLTELIECVWACEIAARSETGVDRYGNNWGSR